MSPDGLASTSVMFGPPSAGRGNRWRRLTAYAVALGGTIAALALSATLADRLQHAPFVFCYVAVALAALYGGLGPSLLATVVGIVGISYLILPPIHAIRIERPADLVSVVAFTIVAVAVSSLTNSLRSAVRRAGWLAERYEAQTIALTMSNDEIRRTAEALDRALEQADAACATAERASAAKSQFLSMISHEFRTPINASLGYADLLASCVAGALTSQQQSYVNRIVEANRHLATLVGDILDVMAAESGRLTVNNASGDAAEPVRQAIALVRPHADARGVVLDDAAMLFGTVIPYVGDVDRVRQVVLNLLTNAIKFTDRHGRIRVACGTTDEPAPEAALRGGRCWAFVRVDDTGCGIAADQLGIVFEPFVQAATASRREGTGLGLAISRQLARLMGGEVSVRSTLGVGSTFTLWLPSGRDRDGTVAAAP